MKRAGLLDVVLCVEIVTALARRFEGFVAHPYLCPAGVPTIGFGATFYEDGRAVKLTDPPISGPRAEALLLWTVRAIYLPAVLRLCPDVDTPERLAALIDFAFNLGTGRLRDSTLRRKVNADDWGGARKQIMRWTMGGGRVLQGLVRRREAERALM
jgi:lysozyme